MQKVIFFLLLTFGCCGLKAVAQSTQDHQNFHGATATLPSYKALYIIDESGVKKMKGVLRNIKNALNDPRLKGKLQVELIAFGDGVEIYKKSSGLDTLLLALQKQGVILAQCENTIHERKISKDDL